MTPVELPPLAKSGLDLPAAFSQTENAVTTRVFLLSSVNMRIEVAGRVLEFHRMVPYFFRAVYDND